MGDDGTSTTRQEHARVLRPRMRQAPCITPCLEPRPGVQIVYFDRPGDAESRAAVTEGVRILTARGHYPGYKRRLGGRNRRARPPC